MVDKGGVSEQIRKTVPGMGRQTENDYQEIGTLPVSKYPGRRALKARRCGVDRVRGETGKRDSRF